MVEKENGRKGREEREDSREGEGEGREKAEMKEE